MLTFQQSTLPQYFADAALAVALAHVGREAVSHVNDVPGGCPEGMRGEFKQSRYQVIVLPEPEPGGADKIHRIEAESGAQITA